VGQAPVGIPTLDEGGLLVLALLLASIALRILRRRRERRLCVWGPFFLQALFSRSRPAQIWNRVAVRPGRARRVVGARYDRAHRAGRGERSDEQPDLQPTRLDLWQSAPDLRGATTAAARPVPAAENELPGAV